MRKQTIAQNAERYTTPQLKELEDSILNAEDKLFTLEYDLFCEIREAIAGECGADSKNARAVAMAGCCSLPCLVWRNRTIMCVVRLTKKGRLTSRKGASVDGSR